MKLNKLKHNKEDRLRKLTQSATLSQKEERVYSTQRSKRKRILSALRSKEMYSLYGKIDNCYPTKIKRIPKGHKIYRLDKFDAMCGNVYCPRCRQQLHINHSRSVHTLISNSEINITYRNLDSLLDDDVETIIERDKTELTNDDLFHLTAVVGICKPTIEEVKNLIKCDKNNWNKIRRNINLYKDRPLWIEAIYEMELVNWKYLQYADESDYKKKQIKQLIKSSGNNLFNKEPFIFLHFHSVTNIPKELLKSVFRDYYFIDGKPLIKTNKEIGCYVQKFHNNKTLMDNVWKVTSYPFKDALRYKHSYIGNDYTNGEPFTDDEICMMVQLYDQIKPKSSSHNSSLFKTVTNRFGQWEILDKVIALYLSKLRKRRKYRRTTEGQFLFQTITEMNQIVKNTERRNSKTKKLRKLYVDLRRYYVTSEDRPSEIIATFLRDVVYIVSKINGNQFNNRYIDWYIERLYGCRFDVQKSANTENNTEYVDLTDFEDWPNSVENT